jgi:hypothetical protein
MPPKRGIEHRCRKRKEAQLVNWNVAICQQKLFSVVHGDNFSPHEVAYTKWLLAHRLERPWREISFTERAEWAQFYINMETQKLNWEDEVELRDKVFKEYKKQLAPQPEPKRGRKVQQYDKVPKGPIFAGSLLNVDPDIHAMVRKSHVEDSAAAGNYQSPYAGKSQH